MSKIVAVMNNQTGKFLYVLQGYENKFPKPESIAVSLEVLQTLGESGEDELVEVRSNGFVHYVDSRSFSFVCEEEEE